MDSIIQLFTDVKQTEKGYPIVHSDCVVNTDGTLALEQVEKQ